MENAKFYKWANSFSGCDGGNKDAPIWVSGIEWGLGKEKGQSDQDYEKYLKKYYQNDLPQAIDNGNTEISSIYDWKEQLKFGFGIVLAKLYSVIKGFDIDSYKNPEIFNGNELFKLNLYPIAFPNTKPETYLDFWEKYKLERITGFHDNENYRIWCFYNRFPIFNKILKSNGSSKLIICTGIDYLLDFYSAFITDKSSSKIYIEKIKTTSKNGNTFYKKYYWTLDKKNLIVVVPFFTGRNGLNSNEIIVNLGTRIKNILDSYNIIL